jgi:hypothetical protein
MPKPAPQKSKKLSPLPARCRTLHRERPELSNRELADQLGMTIGHVRQALTRPEPEPELDDDPPRPPGPCIHRQAHQLRYEFFWHCPYDPAPNGGGLYQQYARRDALDMALASGPIPTCDCSAAPQHRVDLGSEPHQEDG